MIRTYRALLVAQIQAASAYRVQSILWMLFSVIRPVIFLAYGGAMRWRTKAGDEIAARLGEMLTKDSMAQAWRTALDPHGDWMPAVLEAADRRLSQVRAGGMPEVVTDGENGYLLPVGDIHLMILILLTNGKG